MQSGTIKDHAGADGRGGTVLTLNVDEISRIDTSSSASTTPRDQVSISRNGSSPSEPFSRTEGGSSFEDTVTGSEMGSLLLDDDDSDDNF